MIKDYKLCAGKKSVVFKFNNYFPIITFIFNNKMYWSQDRLEFVNNEVKK